MNADQISDGRELSRVYYEHLVRPLLASRWPDLPHAAGRLGQGSDVFGLDDEMSRDHDWGLRLTLLVHDTMTHEVKAFLEAEIPDSLRDYPTRFPFSGETDPRLRITVTAVSAFAIDRLGVDPRGGLTHLDWLALTGQTILEVTAGPLFADTTGEITAVRDLLIWYPDDLWRYLIATAWHRLDEEMPLMSRAGYRGDDLGSRIIAARLVGVIVHLAFLLERRWAPYPKWRGIMFNQLPCANTLTPPLEAVLAATDWHSRQAAMCTALDCVLIVQRTLGLPAPRPAAIPFWERPYRLPNTEIAKQVLDTITDPEIRALPRGRGSIEQQTDNTHLLYDWPARRRLVGDRG